MNELISLSVPKKLKINYKSSKNISPIIDAKSYDYTVEYISSNENVVAVDSKGNVKGNATGEAEITCTVTDKYGNALTEKTTVTVSYSAFQWIIIIALFGWIWYI